MPSSPILVGRTTPSYALCDASVLMDAAGTPQCLSRVAWQPRNYVHLGGQIKLFCVEAALKSLFYVWNHA